MKCEGQKPFRVRKKDKLVLIIDGSRGSKSVHELVRIDFKEQLRFLSKFLTNFISDRQTISNILSGFRSDLRFGRDKNITTFSSFRIVDDFSNIDFCVYCDKGILFVFMAITYKKKPKKWNAGDYFKI